MSNKAQEQRIAALNAEQAKNQRKEEEEESEGDSDIKMDEEELEQIKKESMAMLFKNFKKAGPREPKKETAKKKKKTDDGITEDSFEDEASLESNEHMDHPQFIDTRV